MNELKNYTNKNPEELKKVFEDYYGLEPSEYIVTRVKDAPDTIKMLTGANCDSKISVGLSKDGMKAYLSLYPPVNDGILYSVGQVIEDIEKTGITVNLKTDAIASTVDLYQNGGIVENVLIAEGVDPIDGKDAEIHLNFEPVESKPKLKDDGSVDYKNIDNIRLVRKGDLLLTKKPATSGVKGLNVKNEEIAPKPGIDIKIFMGEGIKSDKVTNEYYSTLDGCVNFKKNKLSVDPVYRVNGNVDYSTGNIVFNGTVYVKHDVLSDFSIRSERDIFIEGVVQDSTLIAGGNITIKYGIKGDSKNKIEAGGDVYVGYCENANIKAKGNIEIIKYCYNSNLKAGQSILAEQGQGVIAGGSYSAFDLVKVNQAGTVGNSNFNIAVGTKYFFEEEINKLMVTRNKYKENMAKVDEFLSKLDLRNKEVLAKPKVRQLLVLRKQLHENIKKVDEQVAKLTKSAHHPNPKIKVVKDVYDGLEVAFYRDKMRVREKQKNIVFFYDDKFSRIAWVSLADQEVNQYE